MPDMTARKAAERAITWVVVHVATGYYDRRHIFNRGAGDSKDGYVIGHLVWGESGSAQTNFTKIGVVNLSDLGVSLLLPTGTVPQPPSGSAPARSASRFTTPATQARSRALRDAMGEEDFDCAWAEGDALSTDEAIAYGTAQPR